MPKDLSTEDYANLTPGDPAPRFRQRCTSNPNFVFDTAAGRYLVLGFYLSAADPEGAAALAAAEANRDLFDDENIAFFGVSLNPADENTGRAKEALPGIRHFWDFDGVVSRLYGAMPKAIDVAGQTVGRRFWMVVDPTLRIMAVFPLSDDGRDAARRSVFDYLRSLPPPARFAGFEAPAPILVLPNVFEADLCRRLIETYEATGGVESGFMREVDGKTVLHRDHAHKRRSDCVIEEPALRADLRARIIRRVNGEIARIYAFQPTRMERYIVGCYAAEANAHFRSHRDNTTRGTAHRRFAVSINLDDDFDGGELGFPEYGPRTYKAPAGTAIVFPCNLLHRVTAVTRGRRYAFLPFLYDEPAALLRETNAEHVDFEDA